jgi:hypothetical protein
VATLSCCHKVTLNDVPALPLINYVYSIAARSRLTDVATTASVFERQQATAV